MADKLLQDADRLLVGGKLFYNAKVSVLKKDLQENLDYNNVVIPLTGNRVAVLTIPKDVNEADVKIIQHYIHGISMKINLEKAVSQ